MNEDPKQIVVRVPYEVIQSGFAPLRHYRPQTHTIEFEGHTVNVIAAIDAGDDRTHYDLFFDDSQKELAMMTRLRYG